MSKRRIVSSPLFLALAFLTSATLGASYAWSYQVVVSTSANRSGAVALSGQTVSDLIYVFIDQNSGPDQVRFSLDGALVKTENIAPWDFQGTTGSDLSMPYDTTRIANGQHTITADIRVGGVTSALLTATFTVSNAGTAYQEGDEAPQFHTGWRQDPSQSLTLAWLLDTAPASPQVRYRRQGTSSWLTAPASTVKSTSEGQLMEATLTGLSANTRYDLKAGLSDGVFSRQYSAATAPASGPQDFDVVFVADTGLIGRLDGLTTGTEQTILEVAGLDPTVVLLGGDYAYFDTDKRYVTLERTIGAWFTQMLPVTERTPMMPTYGNHEVVLGEGFDTWVSHFPTPDGWNARRMYSFDIADAHFISVHGYQESYRLPASGLAWLEADLSAARASGQRWLIPFFHAAPFSDGTNHTSALGLREQLGPLFETYGVQVVLTAHDQSFERTFPLTDVPATNTPTSTSLTCYDMNDGVTWLKVSPGGKLSNISGDFSPWRSAQPPAWTAARDNTHHHFASLQFRASGDLTVSTLSLDGDGVPPTIQDQFRYTTGSCGSELRVSPASLTVNAEPSTTATETLTVAATDEAIAFTVGATPNWLSVNPTSATTPATLSVTVDADLAGPGSHTAQIPLEFGSGSVYPVMVTAQIGGSEFGLRVSTQPDRSQSSALEGATLQNERYIFVAPDVGIEQVRFYFDDPSASGTPVQTENRAPYDFAGTATNDLALPFNTGSRADGPHTITARVATSDGRLLLVTANAVIANTAPQLFVSSQDLAFTLKSPALTDEKTVQLSMSDGSVLGYTAVSNAGWLTVAPTSGETPETLVLHVDASGLSPGSYQGQVRVTAGSNLSAAINVNLGFDLTSPYDLRISQVPSRDPAVVLSGQTVSGLAYVFMPAVSGISSVRFYLDDPERVRAPIKVENNAPWDFAGTDSTAGRPALPFDFSKLSGSHQITAAAQTGSGLVVVSATFVATGQ